MPTCKNFIPKTLGHVAGGLAITAVSSKYTILLDALTSSFGVWGIFGFGISQIILFFVIIRLPANTVYKYIATIIFVYCIGQIIGYTVKRLEADNLLLRVLLLTVGIFVGMILVGLYDSQNLLGYQPYVVGALIGLIIAEIILAILKSTKIIEYSSPMKLLSFIGLAIFAFLTGIDIQVVKEHAKSCSQSPDYIAESMSLFLDFMNMFQKIATIMELNR